MKLYSCRGAASEREKLERGGEEWELLVVEEVCVCVCVHGLTSGCEPARLEG